MLQAVREAGLEEKTLVFFLSDNGGPTTHNAVNGSVNLPLRGGKAETWEGGIRVPFIVQWKGMLAAGKTYDRPVIQMDITATTLAAAGLELKPEWQLDGVDLMPFLLGQKPGPPHEVLYWRLGGLMAVRMGMWKLVTPYNNDASIGPQPTTYDPFTGARLFNVTEDIGEQNPVGRSNQEIVKMLKAKWSAWAKDMPVLTSETAAPKKPDGKSERKGNAGRKGK